MKDNTNLKKSNARPADPVIVRGPNAGVELPPNDDPSQLKLQAFPEGDIFRYQEHPDPAEAGTFIIYDSAKKPVAFTGNPAMARLFCDCVRMLFAAVAQHKRDATPPEHCAVTRGATDESPVMES